MRFQVTVSVAAPASTVWNLAGDPPRWPGLTESTTRAAWVRGDGVAVGNRARVAQPRLGENLWEVTEVSPGVRWAWRTSRPGLKTVATHEVRKVAPGHAELTLGIDQSGPLAPLVGLLMGGRARHYVELEAAGLKRGAEAAPDDQSQSVRSPGLQPRA